MNDHCTKFSLLILTLILLFFSGFILFTFPEVRNFFYSNFQFKKTYVTTTYFFESDIREIANQIYPNDTIISYDQTHLEYYPFIQIQFENKTMPSDLNSLSIWDLTSGEMIQNLELWNKTTGFQEILSNSFTSQMIQVLKSLSSFSGQTRAQLQYSLNINQDDIDRLVRLGIKRNVFKEVDGKIFFLNASSLPNSPETKIPKRFELKAYSQINHKSPAFKPHEVIKLFNDFFGSHLIVKEFKIFYVPFYTIKVAYQSGTIDFIQICGFSGTVLSHQLEAPPQ